MRNTDDDLLVIDLIHTAIAESQIPFDPNCCQSSCCQGNCVWCNGCNHEGTQR